MNQSGSYRFELELQAPTRTRDEGGGFTTTFATVETFFGSLEPATSREIYTAGQRNEEISHTVKRHYRDGIELNMRIKLGSRYFSITGKQDVENRGRQLQITCMERKDLDAHGEARPLVGFSIALAGQLGGIASGEAFGTGGSVA